MSCNTVGQQGANGELQNVPFNTLHTFTQNHLTEPLKIDICINIKAVGFIIKKKLILAWIFVQDYKEYVNITCKGVPARLWAWSDLN